MNSGASFSLSRQMEKSTNSYKEQEHTRQGGEWDHSPEYGSLLGSFRKLLETSVAAMLRARKRERKKEVRAVI